MKSGKETSISDWLSKSESDLASADLLFDHKLYSQALYHLQQSNEKLAKGLLIWIGFLTPKMAKRDLRIKSYLGFQPKEPLSYGHRTMRGMLSDMEKAAPAIEAHLQMLQHKDWKQTTTDFQKTIRRSRKGIQKLKKKPFVLIESEEQLSNEIRAVQEIFGKIDQTMNEVSEKLDKLDYKEILRVAIEIAEKEKFRLSEVDQVPSFQKTRNDIIEVLRLSIFTVLVVAITSFLDPLESVTRYPDSVCNRFDEANPYVIQFRNLRNVIELLLKKSQETLKEES